MGSSPTRSRRTSAARRGRGVSDHAGLVCPTGGGSTAWRVEGSVQGAYCARCDEYAVVTTYWSPDELDPTTYAVRVRGADRADPGHLRALARATGANWREVRARLDAEPSPEVIRARAPQARRVRAALGAAGVRVEVVPPLPARDADPGGDDEGGRGTAGPR